jgi:hypothetical protein
MAFLNDKSNRMNKLFTKNPYNHENYQINSA